MNESSCLNVVPTNPGMKPRHDAPRSGRESLRGPIALHKRVLEVGGKTCAGSAESSGSDTVTREEALTLKPAPGHCTFPTHGKGNSDKACCSPTARDGARPRPRRDGRHCRTSRQESLLPDQPLRDQLAGQQSTGYSCLDPQTSLTIGPSLQ
eukprot:2971145-Amphidinium_carterae.1